MDKLKEGRRFTYGQMSRILLLCEVGFKYVSFGALNTCLSVLSMRGLFILLLCEVGFTALCRPPPH